MTTDTARATLQNIQANLLRAPKRMGPDGETRSRDWSLFFFFRILSNDEVQATRDLLVGTQSDPVASNKSLWLHVARPAVAGAQRLISRAKPAEADGTPEHPYPAQSFRNWLKVTAWANGDSLIRLLKDMLPQSADGVLAATTGLPLDDAFVGLLRRWILANSKAAVAPGSDILVGLGAIMRAIQGQLDQVVGALAANLQSGDPGDEDLGPLPVLLLYEILRQSQPAMHTTIPQEIREGVVRGEFAKQGEADDKRPPQTPVNIAFTFSGLKALDVHEDTLASFPDAFREGMAARAERLRDTGPSAPENWEGELGLPRVHGYFTGGGGELFHSQSEAPEVFWKALRADVAAFNDPVGERGEALRFWMGLLFRGLGLDIQHLELGQDPYDLSADLKTPKPRPQRVEHFGFRDGLSQPFVDIGLADPLPGGGRPGRDGTWTPVAPGEIFLDQRDEDGAVHQLPANSDLRLGSTFIVFRKLEQDVAGFRNFLARQRPGSPDAQAALGAQFVGRWPNGTPLVLSPDTPREVGVEGERTLNDFAYADLDPVGEHCPLGAHIRRANPRDIGGREEARRHRLLRRGVSYGGPLLAAGALGDGERRGLLFFAVNSRIDLQFELIQAEWINGGEFLGQAGLGRCPLTGDHGGALGDAFREAGAVAPVTGLPRFVTLRGGDYFFAPGLDPLRKLSEGERFPPEHIDAFTLADYPTPMMFDHDRMFGLGQRLLAARPAEAVVRIASAEATDGHYAGVVVVARYDDVRQVLDNSTPPHAFSVMPYHQAAQNMTRGREMIIGTDTDPKGPTFDDRQRLTKILGEAWKTLEAANPNGALSARICQTAASVQAAGLRRLTGTRRIDLLADLAVAATYAVVSDIYGVPGPTGLTELAVALPFSRQHVGDLPRDWLAALKGGAARDPGVTTTQIWSALILGDLIGNIEQQAILRDLSRQAASEMLNHIDQVVGNTPPPHKRRIRTLVDAFIFNATDDEREARQARNEPDLLAAYLEGPHANRKRQYFMDVGLILLELVGTSMATIPLTFGSVMSLLLDYGIDLAGLAPMLSKPIAGDVSGFSRLVYEAERLNSNIPVRMRYSQDDTTLASGVQIFKNEHVACLVQAANLDGADSAFKDPLRFSLHPYLPGPLRPIDRYLLFGVDGAEKQCWGRDRVALIVLEECLKTGARLKGLRRVAGPRGAAQKMGGVTVGLPARFTQIAPP